MKPFNVLNYSYGALALSFNAAYAEIQPDDYEAKGYTSNRKASFFAGYLTDPRQAWWTKNSLMKRNPDPIPAASQTINPVVLPTKCQYVPERESGSCDKGCICGTSCDSMFVWNTTRAEPKPQYHICTNWMINHGYQLRSAFREAGFGAVPNRTSCGWQAFTHVTALGVGRGSIDVNGTFEQDHGDAYELARIEGVMKAQYPFVEILIIIATLLGPLLLLGVSVGWCAWATRERKVKYKYRRISSI